MDIDNEIELLEEIEDLIKQNDIDGVKQLVGTAKRNLLGIKDARKQGQAKWRWLCSLQKQGSLS